MDRFEALNNHNWDEYIAPPLSREEHDAFQKQLNELVGVEQDGTERLKLAWIPAFEVWNRYLKRWTPAIVWRSVFDGVQPASEDSIVLENKYRDVGVPRYAIFGLVPEESREAPEKREADGSDEDGTVFAAERRRHEYQRLLTIWEHDPRKTRNFNVCCIARSQEHGTACFGKYRAPDQLDIQWLQRKIDIWGQVLESQAHERSTERDKSKIFRVWMGAKADEDAARREEADDRRRRNAADSWYSRDNLTAKGKWSIPGL